MSEPTTLADVLKSSPEDTSLASDDRLLAVDANGVPKKINHNGFATGRFISYGRSYDLFILGETNSNYGVYGTLCIYRTNGHVSIMIQLRSGDSTAGWHQHSMIVHPDMRYPNLYSETGFVICTYQGKTYNAIKMGHLSNDFTAYFYGMLINRSSMFGQLLQLTDVSDVNILTTYTKAVFMTSLPSISGGGKTLRINQLQTATERRAA